MPENRHATFSLIALPKTVMLDIILRKEINFGWHVTTIKTSAKAK